MIPMARVSGFQPAPRARAERPARNGSHTRGVATMTNEQIAERIELLERVKGMEESGE